MHDQSSVNSSQLRNIHVHTAVTVVTCGLCKSYGRNMKTLTAKLTYLPLLLLLLLLLLLWFDRCEGLTDRRVPAIFFPFGTDEGDSVVTIGSRNCDGPINIPYKIFNCTTLYVSYSCTTRRRSSSSSSSIDVQLLPLDPRYLLLFVCCIRNSRTYIIKRLPPALNFLSFFLNN